MAEKTEGQKLAEQLMADLSLEEKRALLDGLLSRQVSSILQAARAEPAPELLPVPTTTRGFRVRLDLQGTKPPVWRRVEVPGDLTLPRVHDVLQAAMGWTNSHLHQFRTGGHPRSPHFVTHFDLDEGEDGVLEDDVRLDQLIAAVGDRLWYTYDFGDGWEHVLRVEAVLDPTPAQVTCTAGARACPPEDCGGIRGYQDLAVWVRGAYDERLLPQVFEDTAHARSWLPLDWHPDDFDLEQTNADLAVATAEP